MKAAYLCSRFEYFKGPAFLTQYELLSTVKYIFLILLFSILPVSLLGAIDKKDSLLNELDKVILKRPAYLEQKEATIAVLKNKKKQLQDLDDIILINREIINQYNSFICDSAEFYIKENLAIARKLDKKDIITESLLHLSYVYSLSGLFFQASEIFESMDYENLPDHFKAWYCWNRIRYFENLIFYTNDSRYSQPYEIKKEEYRDKVMDLLGDQSEEYKKESAHKMQSAGQFTRAEDILLPIFLRQQPHTHQYAMAAMNLAKHYALTNEKENEVNYLILAAISDVELAVKENEALLSLAVKLYHEGDVDRAYNYIRVALDDALFYNARFKNSVIARIQPIIEDTYLQKIHSQQQNLRIYSIVTSLFVIILIITLSYLFLQIKAVSKARRELRLMNDDLMQLNKKLDEANIVKEHYIGYFMNQCAVYINKLHKHRKNVNLNIKTGQMSNLYRFSTDELENDINELHSNFDKTFLALYPNFVTEFNSLLKTDERYNPEGGALNNELRIYALIKLGITDMKQIADFLHYSVQTVYNYKSKVKGKALVGIDQFEEEVIRIGSIQ